MAGKTVPALLVTANVGSIFEDPSVMLKIWTEEFLQTVSRLDPKFIAVHCQEVGGKNYERSMKHVEYFVRLLMSSEELRLFDKVRVYLDEDFSSAENFTALGNFYFIHESLTDVLIWDFAATSFVPAAGKEVHSGNIEAVTTKEKAKFPQDFFPACKWSRKGFLRTRWSLDGTVFDMINIHLFHDASNFVAMETYPSVYSKNRRRALQHTLDRFHTDTFGTAPFFVFGDFNFRTDTKGVVTKLAEGLNERRLQSQKTDLTKMQYQDDSSQVILSLGKKEFSHQDHQTVFTGEEGKWLKEFDRELESFAGSLFEYPITFGPSYPYEENENGAKSYMKTRCPSWCDRVVLSNTATSLVNNFSNQSGIEYGVMGASTCMGDHKPVFLRVELLSNQGSMSCCAASRGANVATPVCLNGLSRTPILDTLTLPRASYVHDEPYTPESMDTPSPLPSPIPSDMKDAQKTFTDSVSARLREQSDAVLDECAFTGTSEDNRSLCFNRGSDKIESPFDFSYSAKNNQAKSVNLLQCLEYSRTIEEDKEKGVNSDPGVVRNLGSPKVLVTQYAQIDVTNPMIEVDFMKQTKSDSSDKVIGKCEDAEVSDHPKIVFGTNSPESASVLYKQVSQNLELDISVSSKDHVGSNIVFESQDSLPESDQNFSDVQSRSFYENRIQSQSAVEMTVSSPDHMNADIHNTLYNDDSISPLLRTNRCFSDASSLKRNVVNKPLSRVRLISNSDSLARIQSHHSSSDEDWFEEVLESESDTPQKFDSTSKTNCDTQAVSSFINEGDSNCAMENRNNVTVLCGPPFEIHSSLSYGIASNMSGKVIPQFSDDSICVVGDSSSVISPGETSLKESYEVLKLYSKKSKDLNSSCSQDCGGNNSDINIDNLDENPSGPQKEKDNTNESGCFQCGRCSIL